MRKSAAVAAFLLAAGAGGAQGQERQQGQSPQQQGGGGQASRPTSDAFDRACIDLLHGRTPEGEKAIRTLKDACSSLMAGRADERIQAEQRLRQQQEAREQLRLLAEGRADAAAGGTGAGATVEPGRGTAPPPEGEGIRAAFERAGSELIGRSPSMGMGMRRGGPVGYTLVSDPVGYFNGLGANAELYGAIRDAPKFSWVAGARYSQTDVSTGTASTFGALGGVDWYIVGRNNEGLRVGPRLEVAAGREDIQGGDTDFARMGLGGEVGYNFIATNGITGVIGGGIGGRIAGDEQNEDFESFVGGEFGPYARIGLGFSW
jgi:hypothetical protein